MSKFSDKLIVEPVGDGKNWIVYNSFNYQSDVLDTIINIPREFITDGASIPRLFWDIFIPTGPYFQAAVVHDYLYRWQKFTRRQSDDTLLEGMWVLHCKLRQYFIIYIMVRLFGWYAWCRDGKRPISEKDLLINRNMVIGQTPTKYKFWRHS
jgi:hypothetical protein